MSVDRVLSILCVAFYLLVAGCARSQPIGAEEELNAYAKSAGGEWISQIGALQFDERGTFNPAKLEKLSPAALKLIQVISLSRLSIDVAPDVSFLPNLRRLSLTLNKLGDIKALSGLPIKRIDLSYNPLVEIGSLAECTQLESIGLAGTRVAELPDLSKLTKLRQLALPGTPLQSLSNLEKINSDFDLNLLGCNRLNDIDALRLSRVKTLTIDEDNFHRLRPWFDAHLSEIKTKRPQFKVQFQLLSGE